MSESRLRVNIFWRCDDGRSGVFELPSSLALEEIPGEEQYPSPFGLEARWRTWIWEEGNFACDCNRAMFFLGEDDWPCGERISIERMEPLQLV